MKGIRPVLALLLCVLLFATNVFSLRTTVDDDLFNTDIPYLPVKHNHVPHDATLLVSTLDGQLHALEAESGKYLWSFGTDEPLLTSSFQVDKDQEAKDFYAAYHPEDPDAHISPFAQWDENMVVVPSLDGSIFYATNHGLERLPISLANMVEASPFRTKDNTRYFGHKDTTVFVIDRLSGKIQRVISSDGVLNTDLCDSSDGTVTEFDAIWVGKEQLTVQALQGTTAASKWNISIASWVPFFDTGLSDHEKAQQAKQYSDFPIVVNTDGTLTLLDADRQEVAWSHNFAQNCPTEGGKDNEGSTIAAVYIVQKDKHSNVNDIVSVPLSYLMDESPSDVDLFSFYFSKVRGDISKESIYVSEQNNGLFALPHVIRIKSQNHINDQYSLPEGTIISTETVINMKEDCLPGSESFPTCLYGIHNFPILDVSLDNDMLMLEPPPMSNSSTDGTDEAEITSDWAYYALWMIFVSILSASIAVFIATKYMQRNNNNNNNNNTSENTKRKKKKKASKKTDQDNNNTTIRSVGKITILEEEVLGTGSRGTVVFAGLFEGRSVAVKRLVKQFCGAAGASKEINLLIHSDSHGNVLRYHAKEEDNNFIYVALERCALSLGDIFDTHKRTLMINNSYSNIELRKILKQAIDGVSYIHSLNIVHRDIKPHNILLSESKQAKIADMGLGKKLDGQRSSFDTMVTGSVGWQPAEMICEQQQQQQEEGGEGGSNSSGEGKENSARLTKSVDIFSIGCVICYVLTQGGHPFGSVLEREKNIVENKLDLSDVKSPEAKDLIAAMVSRDPLDRISAEEAAHHPLFWTDEKKLQFLLNASDEIEDAAIYSDLRFTIEQNAYDVVGDNWSIKCDTLLLDNLKKFRKYDITSVRDCLRVIRNKKHHYHEMPLELKQEIGSMPSGFVNYFLSRFPNLLMHVYAVMANFCVEEKEDDNNNHTTLPKIVPTFAECYRGCSRKRLNKLGSRVRLQRRCWYMSSDEWIKN